MNILIGADLVSTQSNKEEFETGNAENLIGDEICNLLNAADYKVFNLEMPLADNNTPIDKCGPCLIASTKTIKGYTAIGVDLLTLANNHILDQDTQGLESTLKVLEENNIAYVGVGQTSEEASKPYIFECESKKIGVYACAEHEFSIISNKKGGANPFDPLESLDHVSKLKEQCDYVIVLYHGGKEHYRYPSPNLQRVCRKLVEKGADLVICQHSHCVGCEEKYLDGTIVYGQGNFLFDHSESEYWKTSLLVKIGEDFKIEYIPLVKHGNGVRLAEGDKANEILDGFKKRSEEIKQEGFIEAEYAKFARTMLDHYLFAFSGTRRSFCFRSINKLSGYRYSKWLMKRKYKKQTLLAIRNYVECEAHRELLLEGLKK